VAPTMTTSNLLRDVSIYVVPCRGSEALEDLVSQLGGTVVDYRKVKSMQKKSKKNFQKAFALASQGLGEEALPENIDPNTVVSSNFLEACVRYEQKMNPEDYLLVAEADKGAESETPAEPVKTGQQNRGRKRKSSDAVSTSQGRKAEKAQPWSGEEFRILIEYGRRHRDHFGVSGNKLWEQAESENILPGRSMQAMREAAKRKRAFIEMGEDLAQEIRPGMVQEHDGNATNGMDPLTNALGTLADQSQQDTEAVCWALYQCNGEFQRAKKILFGEITTDDFHPWSIEEDRVITKFARGLLECVLAQETRVEYVKSAHRVTSPEDADAIEFLLNSREYYEIAARARYLVDERLFE